MDFTEGGYGGVDDFLGASHRGDVAAVSDRVAASRNDFISHRLRSFGADVVDHHIGAFGSKGQGIAASESAACAGDQDRPVVTNSHQFNPVFQE